MEPTNNGINAIKKELKVIFLVKKQRKLEKNSIKRELSLII